ncbi:MAG TPA: isocitrate lyase [Candidatus Bathyarchaeia archaeon]|nr:isocitrate lyase [Candidatus Bathyarchaeia archaeon]
MQVQDIEEEWGTGRWQGIVRPYSAADVARLRGTVKIEHTLAAMGASKFWDLLSTSPFIPALGAVTGNQAVQMVQAGLKAIYISGWQVAADANLSGNTFPDLGLYPSNSGPQLVRRINRALQRVDQIQHAEGRRERDWFVPLIADGEAGFGGHLNAYELMKEMIEAGAAGVHFEDQLTSERKCGHLGGKVLVPTSHFIRTLVAARLAADVLGIPTILIARTDAEGAKLISNNADPRDEPFLEGERTPEGYYRYRGGLEASIARGVAYAPYADLVWCETSSPSLEEAKRFAEGIHAAYPGKPLAYNCSSSFNWEEELDPAEIEEFQKTLSSYGYKFQFVTLAGFHSLNHSMFELARSYAREGMTSYVRLQKREFQSEQEGYRAVKHQSFVGTGYFDHVAQVIAGGEIATNAMKDSTETAQFKRKVEVPVPTQRSSRE